MGDIQPQVKMESPSDIFNFEDFTLDGQRKWMKNNTSHGLKIGIQSKTFIIK